MEFTVKTKISAPAAQIYKTWLSSDGHSKMTGGEAMISDKLGSEFSAWDDYISGKNIELEKNSRILQAWRTTEFEDDEPDSLLEITLKEENDQTEIILRHSNLPDHGEQYESGWEVHYFQPMKEYFSK